MGRPKKKPQLPRIYEDDYLRKVTSIQGFKTDCRILNTVINSIAEDDPNSVTFTVIEFIKTPNNRFELNQEIIIVPNNKRQTWPVILHQTSE